MRGEWNDGNSPKRNTDAFFLMMDFTISDFQDRHRCNLERSLALLANPTKLWNATRGRFCSLAWKSLSVGVIFERAPECKFNHPLQTLENQRVNN